MLNGEDLDTVKNGFSDKLKGFIKWQPNSGGGPAAIPVGLTDRLTDTQRSEVSRVTVDGRIFSASEPAAAAAAARGHRSDAAIDRPLKTSRSRRARRYIQSSTPEACETTSPALTASQPADV